MRLNRHLKHLQRRAPEARVCGNCQACCESLVVSVDEPGGFTKKAGTRCVHQCQTGCDIYDDRPTPCREWSCLWIRGALPDAMRPDKSGLILWESANSRGRLLGTEGVGHPVLMGRVSAPGMERRPKAEKTLRMLNRASVSVCLILSSGQRVFVCADGQTSRVQHYLGDVPMRRNGNRIYIDINYCRTRWPADFGEESE